jgi:hypothetical protein
VSPLPTYRPHPLASPGGLERRIVARSRYAHGNLRTAGRLTALATSIACPRAHHIHDVQRIVRESVLRCDHRDVPGGPQCNLLVWLLVHPTYGIVVAEVDFDDLKAMKRQATADDTLAYLGLVPVLAALPPWPTPLARGR